MSRKTKHGKRSQKRRVTPVFPLPKNKTPRGCRLLNLLKKTPKFSVIFFSVSLIFIVIYILFFKYLSESSPAKITGTITQFKDVELSYDTYQSEGRSPLCGCLAEKEAEEWRGITFVARHLQISRTGETPITGYLITNALPERTFWNPMLFKLRATVYSIAIPVADAFDPELLLQNKLPSSQKILESKDIGVKDFVSLFTEKPLNVSLLGNTPLAGWIPVKGSKVSLKYKEGIHADALSVNTASIEEIYSEYNKDSKKINEKDKTFSFSENIDYPLGDFLGPNVVLWTNDKSATIQTEKDIFPAYQFEERDFKRITVVLVKDSAFSVRVACLPFDNDEVIRNVKSATERNGSLFIPDRVRDSGKVVVSIFDPKDQTSEFENIYNFVKENPITWVKTAVRRIDKTNNYDENEWNFRFPPLPNNKGFNIFGPVSDLTLSSVLGSIMIGSKQFPIVAKSNLKLKKIKGLQVEKGIISVPIQVDKNKAELEFEATSEVYVNDESLNKKSTEHKDLSDYFVFVTPIISILSLLISLLGLLINLFVKKSK